MTTYRTRRRPDIRNGHRRRPGGSHRSVRSACSQRGSALPPLKPATYKPLESALYKANRRDGELLDTGYLDKADQEMRIKARNFKILQDHLLEIEASDLRPNLFSPFWECAMF